MAALVGIVVTLVFAALGFGVALLLELRHGGRNEKRNSERFLMTALACVALAVVLSGFVRRPLTAYLVGHEVWQTTPDQ